MNKKQLINISLIILLILVGIKVVVWTYMQSDSSEFSQNPVAGIDTHESVIEIPTIRLFFTEKDKIGYEILEKQERGELEFPELLLLLKQHKGDKTDYLIEIQASRKIASPKLKKYLSEIGRVGIEDFVLIETE